MQLFLTVLLWPFLCSLFFHCQGDVKFFTCTLCCCETNYAQPREVKFDLFSDSLPSGYTDMLYTYTPEDIVYPKLSITIRHGYHTCMLFFMYWRRVPDSGLGRTKRASIWRVICWRRLYVLRWDSKVPNVSQRKFISWFTWSRKFIFDKFGLGPKRFHLTESSLSPSFERVRFQKCYRIPRKPYHHILIFNSKCWLNRKVRILLNFSVL